MVGSNEYKGGHQYVHAVHAQLWPDGVEGMALNRQIRVLVVARSPRRCKAIVKVIRQGGLEVAASAESVTEGLRNALTHRPDAVLLDLGLEHAGLSHMVESLMRSMPIPVVLLSRLTDEEVPAAIEALSLGAVDVVAEPGTITPSGRRQAPEEIVGAVRMAVRTWRSKGWLSSLPSAAEAATHSDKAHSWASASM